MKFQRTIRGPQSGLGLALLALTFTNVAVAQPDGDAAKAAAPPTSSAAASESSKAETAATGDAAAQKAEAAPVATTAPEKSEAATAAVAAPKADISPASESPAGESAPASLPVSVEILPGSGYPAPRVRGIVGGSLWLTMHGHQFPYMGPETSKETARIAISGSVWDDTSYSRMNSGNPNIPGMKRLAHQTRAVLRATPTYTTRDGWFAQGQMEFVANGDQTNSGGGSLGSVDDAYVRAGKWKVFDVTVGRFQGWEVYHYGMGLDLNTLERLGAKGVGSEIPPPIYGVDHYWDRQDGGLGAYAGHVYFTDYLRLEVMGVLGTQAGQNVKAVRPVAVLDLGYFKAKVGTEYSVGNYQADGNEARTKKNGIGGALQFVLDPHIEGGVNAAIGYTDNWDKDGLPQLRGSFTTKSFGGFLNGRIYGPLLVGVGANFTDKVDLDQNNSAASANFGKTNSWSHLQSFAAVQYSFWDKLFFKFVAGYAKFDFVERRQDLGSSYDNTAYSGRLRMMYLF